jgi:hypothetical protein
MRILIDECVDPRVKRLLPDEPSATVHEQGWDALEDGPLLERAEKEFDALVTIDGSLEYQQNLTKYRIESWSSMCRRISSRITAPSSRSCSPPYGQRGPGK